MLLNYDLNSPNVSFVLKFEGGCLFLSWIWTPFDTYYQIQTIQPAFQLSERSNDLQEL